VSREPTAAFIGATFGLALSGVGSIHAAESESRGLARAAAEPGREGVGAALE